MNYDDSDGAIDFALDLIEISSSFFNAFEVTNGASAVFSIGLVTVHLIWLSIAASISIYSSYKASLYLIKPADANFFDKKA